MPTLKGISRPCLKNDGNDGKNPLRRPYFLGGLASILLGRLFTWGMEADDLVSAAASDMCSEESFGDFAGDWKISSNLSICIFMYFYCVWTVMWSSLLNCFPSHHRTAVESIRSTWFEILLCKVINWHTYYDIIYSHGLAVRIRKKKIIEIEYGIN